MNKLLPSRACALLPTLLDVHGWDQQCTHPRTHPTVLGWQHIPRRGKKLCPLDSSRMRRFPSRQKNIPCLILYTYCTQERIHLSCIISHSTLTLACCSIPIGALAELYIGVHTYTIFATVVSTSNSFRCAYWLPYNISWARKLNPLNS